MNLSTFEDCLDRHGADIATWPAALRADAAAFLESSAAGRTAHHDLAEIEAVIRIERPEPADGGAIAARAMRHRQDRPFAPGLRRAGWAAAAVAALVLGLLVGGIGPDHSDSPDHVMTAAFESAGAVDVD